MAQDVLSVLLALRVLCAKGLLCSGKLESMQSVSRRSDSDVNGTRH